VSDTTRLIEAIEGAGWIVDTIDQESCVVRCPKQGCVMRARVSSADQVPPRAKQDDSYGFTVTAYNFLRKYLRERRRKLRLSITEVEAMAGLADGHLLKMEKNLPARTPQFDTIMLWAQALGIRITLMPGPVPPHLKRAIAEAEHRGMLEKRKDRFTKDQLRSYRPEPLPARPRGAGPKR
jgi:transcriptional regulator with XRE-family HTH domain